MPGTAIVGHLGSIAATYIRHNGPRPRRIDCAVPNATYAGWHVLEHGFIHFKLNITPQPVAIHNKLSRAAEPGVVWLSVRDALNAAIPKPVRALLIKLDEIKEM